MKTVLTKRDLGVGYLLGTGLGMLASLLGYLVLLGQPVANTVIAVGSAAVLSVSLIYIGYWLRQSDLGDEVVWRVAQYSSVGLSVPVGVGVLITVVGIRPTLAYLFPSLFINTIAAGAVLGLLLGSVRELRREHQTAVNLNQRNSVLNRVLRHNLRNDLSVILGYVDVMRETSDEAEARDAYRMIYERVEEMMSLSKSARRIEQLDGEAAGSPIDVASLVRERVELFQRTHDNVSFDLELPDEAWADVGPLYKTVIDNLIENAIVHHSDAPRVGIAVGTSRGDDGTVEIVVWDDGAGIPTDELRALEESSETPLHHGSGLGLWVTKWVTESYGGELRIEGSAATGSRITLSLPAASKVERLIGAT